MMGRVGGAVVDRMTSTGQNVQEEAGHPTTAAQNHNMVETGSAILLKATSAFS
jgi:hypothetical protein